MHNQRLKRTGTTDPPVPYRKSMDVKLWGRITKTDTCWIWNGSTEAHGYGQVWHEGRKQRVHRLVYEILVGPIPSGMQMDHLCRVVLCCNPEHVEPVTAGENLRRAFEAKKQGLPRSTVKHHSD